MSESKVSRLIPKGMLGTPGTVVDELVEKISHIEEIYVVARYRGGDHEEFISGNVLGLAFARQVLEKYAMENT